MPGARVVEDGPSDFSASLRRSCARNERAHAMLRVGSATNMAMLLTWRCSSAMLAALLAAL
eukprot:scaffold101527_cov63-Phaeocystis_antarctica.AAC.7